MQFLVNGKHKFVFCHFFIQDSSCSQSYFKSSEGHEPHMERGKQKIEIVESEKMKGNFKTQIKTFY